MTTMNFCPHCGHRIYQHGKTGCEHIDTVGHVVKITTGGFALKHPLAERENDRLFDCTVHEQLSTLAGWPKPGEYAITDNGCGGWSFEPPETARQQCDCTETPADG